MSGSRQSSQPEAAHPPGPESPPAAPSSGGPGYRDPSWLRIQWNTVRAGVPHRLGGGTVAVAVTTLLVVLAVAAGVLIVRPWSTDQAQTAAPAAQPGGPPGSALSPDAVEQAERSRLAAAGWVARNVARDNVVTCDAATCAALASRGYPAASLIRLNWGDGDIRRGDLAVVTGAVRARFGPSLADVLSPQRLAVFGSGASAVEVARIVLAGRDAHERARADDQASRLAAGRRLSGNPALVARPEARRQLQSGRVDARLLTALAPLLSRCRLQVAAFRSTAEEAAAGAPHRTVEISRIDGMRVDPDSSAARAIVTFVTAQRPPYGPGRVDYPRDGPVLRISYPAPGPLGLMNRR